MIPENSIFRMEGPELSGGGGSGGLGFFFPSAFFDLEAVAFAGFEDLLTDFAALDSGFFVFLSPANTEIEKIRQREKISWKLRRINQDFFKLASCKMISQNSGNSMPFTLAAFGKRLVSVIPGTEFTSSNQG